MQKKHLIAYPVTAVVALTLGAAAGGESSTAESVSRPTVTVSATSGPAPATTVTATTTATTTATATVTKTAAPPLPKAAMAGDGTYEVGVDVKPGTYVAAPADSGNCYWERSKGGGFSGIIENDNTSGQALVTIKATDKLFTSSGCSDWTKR